MCVLVTPKLAFLSKCLFYYGYNTAGWTEFFCKLLLTHGSYFSNLWAG